MSVLFNEEYFKAAAVKSPGKTSEHSNHPFQPVHTVYGGAQLFKETTVERINSIARDYFNRYAPDAESLRAFFPAIANYDGLAAIIHNRITDKLKNAVEDFRIDFEDGYGYHTDDEEDAHAFGAAIAAAAAHKKSLLPPLFGIRIKPCTVLLRQRALRTLEIFLSRFAKDIALDLPQQLIITLPKVQTIEQAVFFSQACDNISAHLNLPAGFLRTELMIEVSSTLFDIDGNMVLPKMIDASLPRLYAIHAGIYDFTADLNIPVPDQDYRHPYCDMLRFCMQSAALAKGVNVSDGATGFLPIEKYKWTPELQQNEMDVNMAIVNSAWSLHFNNTLHSIRCGIFQGWDLHPAQIPARLAALYYYFLKEKETTFSRFAKFVNSAANAVQTAGVFDDAATGQGMLNYLIKGYQCGAFTDADFTAANLDLDILKSKSFTEIINRHTL